MALRPAEVNAPRDPVWVRIMIAWVPEIGFPLASLKIMNVTVTLQCQYDQLYIDNYTVDLLN